MKDKNEVRKVILGSRKLLTAEEIEEKSSLIGKKLFQMPEFLGASAIMFYISFSSEVRTIPMIKESLEKKKKVFAPYIANDDKIGLNFAEMKDLDNDLKLNRLGILEPKKELRVSVPQEILEMIVVPGVAFDKSCRRLGYGRGYYDRFLMEFLTNGEPPPFFIGLCYELQLIDQLPECENDVKMDKVITESRVLEK